MDNSDLKSLTETRTGYPWLLNRHPMHRGYNYIDLSENIMGLGLRWQSLIVSPEKLPWMNTPETTDDPKFAWWDNLRDVDCSWVSNLGESEKFLFYDGPTLARSPLKLELENSVLKIESQDLFTEMIPHVPNLPAGGGTDKSNSYFNANRETRVGYFIDVGRDGIATANRLELDIGKSEIDLGTLEKIDGPDLQKEFLESLTQSGLRPDEAQGLVDSWQIPFFESPGRRVVFLLHPIEYKMMIQMKCRPAPTTIARVGLVMTEFNSK